MPRLLNIRTNLSDYKAPKYGYDRLGAGPRNTNASGQPYEVENIPKRTFDASDFGRSTGPQISEDFLIRGGTLVPERIAKDVSRLSKMFFDLKSPNGILFTAKQEALSRTGVNVLATSTNRGDRNNKNRRAFNNGIYLPTSTLAQAAVNPLGGHLLKQGLDPTADTGPKGGILGGILNDLFNLNIQDPLGNPTYFSTAAYKERVNNRKSSRLINFLENNLDDKNGGTELYNYSGGPDSVLGVGKTRINILNDQRTGVNNVQIRNSGFSTGIRSRNYSVFKRPTIEFEKDNIFQSSVSKLYQSFVGTNLLLDEYDESNTSSLKKSSVNVFQNGFKANTPTVGGLGTTLNYDELMKSLEKPNVLNEENVYTQVLNIQDFRQKREKNQGLKSLDYTKPENRIEGRVNLGNPGKQLPPNSSYVTGFLTRDGKKEALDKLNELPIYQSKFAQHNSEEYPTSDLCKFRIGVISNNDPKLKRYIHFRAFLDSMDDSYSANWSSQNFAGRAEKLYNYQDFDRQFKLSWTVVAQSKQELIPMYHKLNYLASVCAPDYSDSGYMRGNLIELTVGGYLFNQVGIMTGLDYTIPMDSPWEIAINDTGVVDDLSAKSDPTVKELPFMIKVSGFSFIPIHNFVPRTQVNEFKDNDGYTGPLKEGKVADFGVERYIALSEGTARTNQNNYDNFNNLFEQFD